MFQVQDFPSDVIDILYDIIEVTTTKKNQNVVQIFQDTNRYYELYNQPIMEKEGYYTPKIVLLTKLFEVAENLFYESSILIRGKYIANDSVLSQKSMDLMNIIVSEVCFLHDNLPTGNEQLQQLVKQLGNFARRLYPKINENSIVTHNWNELKIFLWGGLLEKMKASKVRVNFESIYQFGDNERYVFYKIYAHGKFTELNLTENNLNKLTSEKWKHFLNFLSFSPIKKLTVSNNKLNQWPIKRWKDFFSCIADKNLELLDLSHNDLDAFPMLKTLFESIQIINVKKLILLGNTLQQLKESEWNALLEAAGKNNLEELDLSHNGLIQCDEIKWSTILQGLKGIKSLDLNRNGLKNMNAECWGILSEGLKTSNVIKLDMGGNFLEDDRKSDLEIILNNQFIRTLPSLKDLCFFSIFGSKNISEIKSNQDPILKNSSEDFLNRYQLIL